jgi:hypothetical protein
MHFPDVPILIAAAQKGDWCIFRFLSMDNDSFDFVNITLSGVK